MFTHFFYKVALPKEIPRSLKKDIVTLSKLKTKKACLERIRNLIVKKYKGCRMYEEFSLYLYSGLKIKSRRMHCTNLNYLVRFLLVRSGHFKEEDISLAYSFIAFSPHQYLKVRIGNKYMPIDAWAWTLGKKLGEYGHGWNMRRSKSF
jgi:hypothetical protein